MAIPNAIFPEMMVINELRLQCTVSIFTFETMQGKRPGSQGHYEMFGHTLLLLASAGVISSLLYPGKHSKRQNDVATRCERLRRFIGVGELPTLQQVGIKEGVRNAFMHIDERLDEKLPRLGDHMSYSPWMISSTAPGADTLILRRLDPDTLTVWYDSESLNLAGLDTELRELDRLAVLADDRLRDGEVLQLWDRPLPPPGP